jgi:hypothetical protein
LDTTIPRAHKAEYKLNQNYIATMKQNIDQLLTSFIQPLEEVTWLLPIVIVPKKNGKLRIYVNFIKLSKTTKKDPFPLPFANEKLNTMARCEAYSFLDGYFKYHQISIVP